MRPIIAVVRGSGRALLPPQFLASLFLALLLTGAAWSQPAAPSFEVYYEKPSDETLVYAELIRDSGFFDEVVADLNKLFRIPTPVAIRFVSAPAIGGPQYGQGQIVMPYEFLAQNDHLMAFMEYNETPEEQAEALLQLVEFVLHHEVGHALIDVLGLPVLGREEDAVDQLAAVVAAYLGEAEAALVSSDVFAMGAEASEGFQESEFWDSHSLSEQRMYNIACLIYGSDPEGLDGLLEGIGMPAEQAPRCVQDYIQAAESWRAVLGPALLVE